MHDGIQAFVERQQVHATCQCRLHESQRCNSIYQLSFEIIRSPLHYLCGVRQVQSDLFRKLQDGGGGIPCSGGLLHLKALCFDVNLCRSGGHLLPASHSLKPSAPMKAAYAQVRVSILCCNSNCL